MGIHPKPQLFPATMRFFPFPPAVPEKHTHVAGFQHYEPVALGFEAKTNEIAGERDRSIEVRNLQQDMIDFWRRRNLGPRLLPENSDGRKREVDRLTGYAKNRAIHEVNRMITHKDGLGWLIKRVTLIHFIPVSKMSRI